MSLVRLISLFPLWAILASICAYFQSDIALALKPTIVPLLALIMLCMGVTLRVSDFMRVFKRPKVIFFATCLQFFIMPLAAFIISKALEFSPELMAGMVLVGTVSSGTASNVMAYIAKANVALSITMTIISSLLSVVITPYLTLLYVGQSVPVPALSMLVSILELVVAPVVLGITINYFFFRHIQMLKDIFALLAIVSIVTIIAIVVGINVENINSIGLVVLLGIILHNTIGLVGGYFGAKLLGYDKKTCKTIAIEVGMQNSGLAVALAMKYFTPISALPGAIFSIWHNISGSILAGFWSKDGR